MARKYILKGPSPFPAGRIDYARELNPPQLEVVMGADGPSLVLAGAGSGKTRTLVFRVLYLLEKGIPPQRILFVTFTNKAAFEMKSRIEKHLGAAPKGLWCGTFHHAGHRSLRLFARKARLSDSFGILDEEDARDLVRSCYRILPFKPSEVNFPKANVVYTLISFATNTCRGLHEVLETRTPYFLPFEREIIGISREYELRKQKSQNLDYDDLLKRWIQLLEDSPEVRERFTDQFLYCLVDEFQDTNPLQNRLIQILASRHRNLLVVGDDAQSIYSFRGAEIRNILDFPTLWPDAKIFRLETNYRSTPEILNLANDIMSHNIRQFPKQLESVRESGPLPELVRVRDLQEQSAFVAQRVLELVEEGLALKDIAVLFRARYQSAELELELSKRKIPYVLRGGIRFFEQAHIKDVLSYLKLIENPQDELAWLRALRLYPGIGETLAHRIWECFLEKKSGLEAATELSFGKEVAKRAQPGLEQFKKLLRELLRASLRDHPDRMIEIVLESGYIAHVRTHFENAQDRAEDLRELMNFAHTYRNLSEFLYDVSLRESFKGESIQSDSGDWDTDHLVLSTIHQAKGLEWKAVILIGLSEGQFPHPSSLDSPDELEEERRLFYVAVTRAKETLILTHPMTRFEYHLGTVIARPSPFITEISPELYESLEVERSESFDEETPLTVDEG